VSLLKHRKLPPRWEFAQDKMTYALSQYKTMSPVQNQGAPSIVAVRAISRPFRRPGPAWTTPAQPRGPDRQRNAGSAWLPRRWNAPSAL
jgi:hypothetical protein